MASTIEYLDYVLDLLRLVDGITYKKMMGEYILYKDGVVFGGIYDNRFLIKKTDSSCGRGLKEEIPYPTGKPMLLVDCENPSEIKELVSNVFGDLK